MPYAPSGRNRNRRRRRKEVGVRSPTFRTNLFMVTAEITTHPTRKLKSIFKTVLRFSEPVKAER
jgi:hypothetical protein